ncbi:MAG: hypothetical protein H0T89_14790 [Deltaproteobacteria bacterium]|nr:hypothetical protein [Deltaproteobacteria bacterium]MDQ3295476.1 hypothetical protein [Myxococcota bacterium]
MNIVDELHAIAAALRGAGIPYAVCGGIAVTAHGATRSTKDIDVVLAREHLSAALVAVAPLGYNIPAGPMVFGAGTPQERHVQRVNKIVGAQHLILDLLLAEQAYAGVLDDRVDVELGAGTITFVSRETLLRMKRLAGRPIDLADIEKLEGRDER